jgi:uncharacterized protein YbaP (TraB family)
MRPFFSFRSVVATLVILIGLVLPAAADPVIWHLSDEDSDIYIFGTVHILPPDLEWQSDEITAAFESADTIWFEAPAADPAAQLEAVQLIFQYGLNEPGNPLSAQISEEARALLDDIVSQFGMGAADLEVMRPWMAEMTLSLAFIQSQGYEAESGVEFVLWEQANAAGKDFSYFETLEQQVRFLADLPPEIEAASLEQTLLTFDEADDELDALVEAWAAGNIGAIDEMLNEQIRETTPEVHEALIVQRNRNWIESIKETLAGAGSHFIAVGAGHMAGSESVIELLRAEGFEITGP